METVTVQIVQYLVFISLLMKKDVGTSTLDLDICGECLLIEHPSLAPLWSFPYVLPTEEHTGLEHNKPPGLAFRCQSPLPFWAVNLLLTACLPESSGVYPLESHSLVWHGYGWSLPCRILQLLGVERVINTCSVLVSSLTKWGYFPLSPLGVVRLGQCDSQNSCVFTGTSVQCSILSRTFDDGGSDSQGVQQRRACPSDSYFYLLWSLIEDLIDISEKEVEGRHYDLLRCKGDCYGWINPTRDMAEFWCPLLAGKLSWFQVLYCNIF